MITTLEDLLKHIRASIPYPQSLVQLKINKPAGGVTFIWSGTEFFVKPSLNVLEVRGHSLFITGLSTLLQSVLMNADQSSKRFESILDTLTQAEDLVRTHHNARNAAQLVASARQALERISPRSTSGRMAA